MTNVNRLKISQVLTVLILFLMSNYTLANEEKVLLADAIKVVTQIGPDLDIKVKLSKYEEALSKIDEITENHAATDTGLKLLTDQKVGSFDPKKLRKDYLKLLFKYQDVVCEITPSYMCLGYISLKVGIDQCDKAKDWSGLLDGHDSLMNAINIFHGQKADPRHQKISLSTYRGCSSNLDQSGKDYFSHLLVGQLLKQNRTDLAKGIIQKMVIPYYKFVGILSLKKESGEKVDNKYIKRLTKYLNAKLSGYGTDEAVQEFLMFYLDTAESKLLEKQDVIKLRDKIRVKGGAKTAEESNNECLPWIQTATFDQDIGFRKFMFESKSKPGGVKDLRQYFGNGVLTQIPDWMNGKWKGFYEPCIDVGKPYKLGLALFTDILFEKGKKDADKFLEYFKGGSRTQGDILGEYMDVVVNDQSQVIGVDSDGSGFEEIEKQVRVYYRENPSVATHGRPLDECLNGIQTKLDYIEENKDRNMRYLHFPKLELTSFMASCGVKDTTKGRPTALDYVENYRLGEEGYYVLLKKLIDFNQVCKSSKILFKNIKSDPVLFSKAVDYIVNSPQVDPKEKYECGDAELETLLM